MKTKQKTVSETLFEELCNHQGVACTRLQELLNAQQPDYEVRPSGRLVVAEVKQIDPNEEDKAFHKALECGEVASRTRNPDHMAERVRSQIDSSRPQIRQYLADHPNTPAILVLYDNAHNKYTNPYTIQVALHGWEQVTFRLGRESTTVAERGFGYRNNKALREGKNEHLSALATLHECWEFDSHERNLYLQFYHNPFATIPLNPLWWQHPKIAHFALEAKVSGKFQDWAPIRVHKGDI